MCIDTFALVWIMEVDNETKSTAKKWFNEKKQQQQGEEEKR